MSTTNGRGSVTSPKPETPQVMHNPEGRNAYGWSQIGVHDLVPKLGYREYWYPAIEARRVGRKAYWLFGTRKPTRVKMLGEDIVLFRGKDGKIGAVWNRCPHRGALLSFGVCEFEGTISCPYHGYTFDQNGVCVGALTEGPDSPLNGKLRVKSYPTEVVNGVVYVWMGQTEPVPIQEDLPEHFFDSRFATHTYRRVWPMNWSLTMENNADAHDSYIHRFRVRRIFNLEAFRPRPAFWGGTQIVAETDNSIAIQPMRHAPKQAYYPSLGKKWPQRMWWMVLKRGDRGRSTFLGNPYSNTYRLPSITYVDVWTNRLVTQYATPMDEDNTMMFLFVTMRGGSRPSRLWAWLYSHTWHTYQVYKGVNELEDLKVQSYERLDPSSPQKLGANDRGIINWRRKMPLKSRDARRVWGQAAQEAIERDAENEAKEDMAPHLKEAVEAGDNN